MSSPAVIFEERLRVPAEAHDLDRFRRWAFSHEFPESGRIDFLGGDVEVDLGPEDLHTHGRVKSAISRFLEEAVGDEDRGEVFIDRARVSSRQGDLSVEPDVVAVLWESLESGRVRYVPAAGGRRGRFWEIEGAPDLVVEIVSDSSVAKDTRRLPERYAAAGVPELWLVDARGEAIDFRILVLDRGAYRSTPAGADGAVSPLLGRSVRVTRELTRFGTWRYFVETTPDPGSPGS